MEPSRKHIQHLSKADPILKAIIASVVLPIRKPRKDYFHALARSIMGQQLSVKAANTIHDRVVALFRVKIFPSPQQFLKMPDKKLRQAGLSFSKISYLKNLARFVIQHKKEFSNLRKLSDEEIISLLTQVKGIGRWTAEMFLIFTLKREDIFSHGDLGLRNAIVKLYKLRGKPDLKKFTLISDQWKPYRSIASLYLWASLNRGPGDDQKRR